MKGNFGIFFASMSFTAIMLIMIQADAAPPPPKIMHITKIHKVERPRKIFYDRIAPDETVAVAYQEPADKTIRAR